jgi:threonine/homoserine/homoserine lactone efflux protein
MFPETLIPVDPSIPLQFFLAAGVALAAAAPIGAISILTIHRAMSIGFWRAFWPTLGAVTANGIFGVIAALGSGYLTSTIMGSKFWFKLIGSVIPGSHGLKALHPS